MSSTVVEVTFDSQPIAAGTVVVVDSPSFKIRAYDSNLDALNDIIGVVIPKLLYAANMDAVCPAALKADYFLVNDYLQYETDIDENYIENENFDPTFNYSYDDAYVAVCICGVAGVNTSQAKPTQWKKLFSDVGSSSSIELYLIR